MKKQISIKTLCKDCATVRKATAYPHKNSTTVKKDKCEVCKTQHGLSLWIV